MTEHDVRRWLDRYVEAWRANDAELIGDLFSEDAMYHADPWDDGVQGRREIVREWLDSAARMPMDFEALYHPLVINGETAVAAGFSNYFKPDGSIDSEWGNCFLLEFDDAGRCRSYREWFTKKGVNT